MRGKAGQWGAVGGGEGGWGVERGRENLKQAPHTERSPTPRLTGLDLTTIRS